MDDGDQQKKVHVRARNITSGRFLSDSQSPKILIVDDRIENLYAIEKILKPLSLTVIKATSGNTAVGLALEHEFSVVLLDVQMPNMDGFEVAALLRENEKSKTTPIIFITSISKEQSHVFEGYETGAVDYLFKPIDERMLKSKVSVFVELYLEKHKQVNKLVIELQQIKLKLEQRNNDLKELARNDPLTNLPNRLQFEEFSKHLISGALRFKRKFALLLIDLDHFKIINDTLGHDIGDLVLKESSSRFLSAIRQGDFVARLGGDEFAILLTDLKNYHQAGLVAKKIVVDAYYPYYISSHELHVGASIGIACFPSAGKTLTDLIKSADIALYKAKSKGRNCIHYFTEKLNEEHKYRTTIEKALHFAIDRDEFYLVYQPIIDNRVKKVIGMEALIRWRHKELGLIPPSRFIPISEEIGLAAKLGEWVLENACSQFSKWYESGHKDLRFSMNVSVCQLLQAQLLNHVSKLQKKVNIPAEKIVLELTETALMLQENRSLMLLDDLSKLGFQISIDDFGTGYSSLSRLQNMPINILKIDQTFIRNLGKKNDEVIVKAILDLAKNLKFNVVAEGVETKGQEAFLIRNNCFIAQGFLYSKPKDVQAMTLMLEQQRH